MKLLSTVLIVILVKVLDVAALHRNPFDVIRGCKQYDRVASYDEALVYFPVASLLHAGVSEKSQSFKIAILGPDNGIVRFGESLFPYDKDVIEIVLGGWENTKSVARKQHRTASNETTNIQLAEAHTPNLMSPYRPVMFVLEVFRNGTVEVRIDGQDHPFLSFYAGYRTQVNYMAFTKWRNELVYFYDCPLDNPNAGYGTVLLNCTLVL
ncbi:uncharacterized protein LOC126561011 [Anopheles maculipalpis]|uniref:uncharacterized protein LOC126561011 n=1 Tax=Anopheles maculipalpis TaxID=1496333 RepID=UPI0021592BB2|nr:uncharacterized protein LOC126561011 [Anopheles maculipalpis]